MNGAAEINAIQRQEAVVDYLRDQVHDVRDGMSLRSMGQLQAELEQAESKLKRLRATTTRAESSP